MDIFEIEHRWSESMRGMDEGALTTYTFIEVGENLLNELAAHLPVSGGGKGDKLTPDEQRAEQLDHFIRLSLLDEWSIHRQERFAEEFPRLYKLHKADPERYPAHWWAGEVAEGARPDVFAALLPIAAFQSTFSPAVTREQIAELEQLALDGIEDPAAARELRISVLQAMDHPREMLELIEERPLPAAEGVSSLAEAADWMKAYDQLAMAYLELGEYDKANDVVQTMMDSGIRVGSQPMVMVAESLMPLAGVVDVAQSVNRARYVLNESVGSVEMIEAQIQVAEFLLRGGLKTQALGLIEQLESLQDDTDHVAALAKFFRAAVEHGLGDYPLPRYASPRWQAALGGYGVTIAELAELAMDKALAEARAFDERNQSGGLREKMLRRAYEVPALDEDWFIGTSAGVLGPLGATQLVPLPVGATVEPRLDIFYRGSLESDEEASKQIVEEMNAAGGLPCEEDLHRVLAALDELQGHDDRFQIEQAEEPIIETMNALQAKAESGDSEAGLALGMAQMALALRSASLGPRTLTASAPSIPLMAHFDPERALVTAALMSMTLAWRYRTENEAALALSSFAAGLVASGVRGGEIVARLATRLTEQNRHLEAVSIATAALTEITEDSMRFDDPLEEQIRILGVRSDAFQLLCRPLMAAGDSFRLAELQGDAEQRPQEIHAYAVGVADLLEGWRVEQAMQMLDGFALRDEDRDIDRAVLEGVRLRAACYFMPEHYAEAFEGTWARFRHLTDAALPTLTEAEWSDLAVQVINTIKQYRKLDRVDGALEIGGWLVATSAERTGSGEAMARAYALDTHGVTLSVAGRHEESALTMESLVQFARRAGLRDMEMNGLARLEQGTKIHQAYEDAYYSLTLE